MQPVPRIRRHRPDSRGTLMALAITLLLFPGCRTQVVVPPITAQPTGIYDAGRFVWADLVTSDVQAARQFYGSLFGWEFEGDPGTKTPFTLISQAGTPIGGIVFSPNLRAEKQEARWLSYISVVDVDSAAARVRRGGGSVYVEPFDVPNRGRMAVVLDPQSVPLGLLRSQTGDPPDDTVKPYRWMWRELWTSDTAGALPFYTAVAGYARATVDLSIQSEPYTVLTGGGKPRAGMGQITREGVEPLWLPYVNVEDPLAIAETTLRLGGAVLIAPNSTRRKNTVAVIADPTGGILAVQQWTAADRMEERKENQP